MAVKEAFESFLDDQQQSVKAQTNWNEVKEEWINNISIFYSMVEELLNEYVATGKVSIHYDDYTVYEQNLGSYDTKKLIISLGRKQVDFIPVGRLILGAQGRIDMEGVSGRVRFVFTGNDSKDQAVSISFKINGESLDDKKHEKKITHPSPSWKISTPPPQLQYININEESFLDALMEVSNG